MDEVTPQDLLSLIRAGWRYAGSAAVPDSEAVWGDWRNDHGSRAVDFIRRTYSACGMLRGPAGDYPVAYMPVSRGIAADPNELIRSLARPEFDARATDLPEGRWLVQSMAGMLPRTRNEPTYCLDRLFIGPEAEAGGMACHVGDYNGMLATADYLELELLGAAELRTVVELSVLPARRRILDRFESPLDCLARGGGVEAVIGASVLVVYACGGEHFALWERRSHRVGPPGAMHHVIPAMLYQPIGVGPSPSLMDCILREYLEELFGYPEPHEYEGRSIVPPDRHPNRVLLDRLMAHGGARIETVGVAFNLLNHRPEVCTVLAISDPSWFALQTSAGSGLETLDLVRPDQPDRPGTLTLPVNDDAWLDILRPDRISPPGAAGIVEGMKRAAQLLNFQPPAWLRKFAFERSD